MDDTTKVDLSFEVLVNHQKDLAPEIVRQRMVIEGTPAEPITADAIARYLSGLSEVCEMTLLLEPVTHRSDRFGWAGWVHWESSGAHFYAWDRPRLFFSVDIYTCQAFAADRVLEYTSESFRPTALVAFQF